MTSRNDDRETYEILQVIPATSGWWMEHSHDGKLYYSQPLALALIECRWGTTRNKFVGPIDGDGGVAHADYCFQGLVFSLTNPAGEKGDGE